MSSENINLGPIQKKYVSEIKGKEEDVVAPVKEGDALLKSTIKGSVATGAPPQIVDIDNPPIEKPNANIGLAPPTTAKLEQIEEFIETKNIDQKQKIHKNTQIATDLLKAMVKFVNGEGDFKIPDFIMDGIDPAYREDFEALGSSVALAFKYDKSQGKDASGRSMSMLFLLMQELQAFHGKVKGIELDGRRQVLIETAKLAKDEGKAKEVLANLRASQYNTDALGSALSMGSATFGLGLSAASGFVAGGKLASDKAKQEDKIFKLETENPVPGSRGETIANNLNNRVGNQQQGELIRPADFDARKDQPTDTKELLEAKEALRKMDQPDYFQREKEMVSRDFEKFERFTEKGSQFGVQTTKGVIEVEIGKEGGKESELQRHIQLITKEGDMKDKMADEEKQAEMKGMEDIMALLRLLQKNPLAPNA